MVIGAGRFGGVVEARVVCGCRGTGSGRAQLGRHKLVGQGVLVAVAAAYSLVAVATVATWLGFPPINISCLQALTKTRSRQSGRLPYGGSVVLFSACKVVVPNAE